MHRTSLAVLLAILAAPTAAQEATIYRDRGFSGPAMAASEAQPDLGLAWPVWAIRVASGT